MIVLLIVLSFLLDDILFQVVGNNTIFFPLCTLLSLVVIYPFVRNNLLHYYAISIILGVLYDICYSGTLFLHVALFILLSFFIAKCFSKLSINMVNTYCLGIAVVLLYRVFLMMFFVLLKITPWNLENFLDSILSSILFNSFYLGCFYFLAKKMRLKMIKKKYSLLKIQ